MTRSARPPNPPQPGSGASKPPRADPSPTSIPARSSKAPRSGPTSSSPTDIHEQEKALSLAIKAGELERAAHIARSLKNPRYAARLFLEANLPYQAAICSYEAGDRQVSLETFLKVAVDDARYRKACTQALRVASELGALSPDLDRFVESFLAIPPATEVEAQALYRLGVLYQENELFDHAREAFGLVLLFDPQYLDARQRVSVIVSVLKNETLYRTMIRQDAGAWRRPRLGALESHPILRSSSPALRSKAPPVSSVSTPLRGTPPSLPPMRPLSETFDDAPYLPAGFVVAERYRIEEELGRGGMGIVYRATDLELGEAIAIKVFGQRLDERDLVSRFKQELSICRSLAHPNIIRLHDIGAQEGRKFITMELLAGASLKSVATQRLSRRVIVGLLEQACAGVGEAHAHGIVHRDIKPDNLFLTTAGVVKVMDFGLAKRLFSLDGESNDVTVAGFIGGSAAYMAPEQITDFGHVGFAADIYSLGVVAYELFAGTRPFEETDRAKLFRMHLSAVPAPPSAIEPSLGPSVDRVVMRCLEKEPKLRFSSCAELGRAFTALAE